MSLAKGLRNAFLIEAAIASVLLIGAVPQVRAMDRDLQEQVINKCVDAAHTSGSLRQCIEDDLTANDQRLNQVYKALYASLAPIQQVDLKREERAWINDRDNGCRGFAVQKEPDDTYLQQTWYDACRDKMVQQRADQLVRRLRQGVQ